jgi:hypothetical protein
MGTLVNGVGIFVLTLGAVIVGGFINASCIPCPISNWTRTARSRPSCRSSGGHGEEAAARVRCSTPSTRPGRELRGRLGGALPADQHGSHGHDQKAIDSVQKNMPLIRNNLLLLMSNRNYQSMMSREGKEKLRAEALAEIRNVQKKRAVR